MNEAAAVKVSLNDFVLKAVAGALREVPEANAIWTGDAIRRFDSRRHRGRGRRRGGLLTPVLRGVETGRRRSIAATTVADLAERARAGRLKQQELEGGSFSVSNLGMFGVARVLRRSSTRRSPAILAVGAAHAASRRRRRRARRSRTVMTVTLSADHRVIDGALAAQWIAAFTAAVEQPFRLLV